MRAWSTSRRRLAVALWGVALLGAGLPACSTITGTPSGRYRLTAYFPKAVSLYGQSDVRVLGLGAGKVTAVATEGDRVRVDMRVNKDIVLPEGVHATIVPQSLIGQRYVQLYPAWVQGQPRLDLTNAANRVIPLDRTTVPVEPDEALAALKHLLDDLDPSATGRLVNNLSQDLSGNGQNINNAVAGLATLTSTLASKDQQLGDLINNFAGFTTTLDTRESELGKVLDLFAQTTSLLAQERNSIATLVHNLGSVSNNALDLVSKHGPALETDVNSLTGLLAALDANLPAVSTLLSSAPVLVAGQNLDSKAGLIAAYNAPYHRIDLRTQLTPLVNGLLNALGLPLCLNLPLGTQTTCPKGTLQVGAGGIAPAPAGAATPAPGSGAAPTTTVAPAQPTTTTTRPAQTAPFSSTTTTTQPPSIIPPILGLPDVPVSPLSGVLSLLGSGGTANPQQVALTFSPTPAHHAGGLLHRVAHWSHSMLENLW